VCGGAAGKAFFESPGVPVHCNVLWPSALAAKTARRGDIRLAFCPDCGLVFNQAFDPSLVTYDIAYENSLHYSPRFETYARELANDLSERFALSGRLVAEVGCGKGEFLRQLCKVSGARGLGIDASYDPAAASGGDDTVTFMREPFSALPHDVQPALILCRHVVEHLEFPVPFVAEFTAAARRAPGCRVFIEVPNVLFTLRDLGIWDLIYEHCSYFSAPSLSRVCEEAGLRVDRVWPAYGDQFLCIEASADSPPTRPEPGAALRELEKLVERFADEYRRKAATWALRLRELAANGHTVALWGAGSKGITFVNTVPGAARIACLVDLNPRKQGRFVPVTGQPVVAPEALRSVRPDVVLVMNPLYQQEIGERLESLGVQSRVEVA
jgi:hypothetical protein